MTKLKNLSAQERGIQLRVLLTSIRKSVEVDDVRMSVVFFRFENSEVNQFQNFKN